MNATNLPGIVAPQELGFLSTVNAAQRADTDLTSVLASLHAWHAHIERTFESLQWPLSGFKPDSAFVAQAHAIGQTLRTLSGHWAQQRSELVHASKLAELLDDKVILLVFGKFNVGKSAFCNLLAQRFAAYEQPVQYFHLENGAVVETSDTFAEGETETTARLQGVCLGQKLVLLDTPGLHSVTGQNAELTKRFIESADGLLWLSSSASPGQTQELEELSTELRRGKPLLPVLTRSDVFEEDEVDGEIQKLLRNKTPENRALQENDVCDRASAKLEAMGLDASILAAPVSISTHMARTEGLTPQALEEAGFEGLYAALMDIIQPALAYKQRKPAEVLLHHQEENVLGSLYNTVLPQLSQLHVALNAGQQSLLQAPDQILKNLWRKIAPLLPAMLEEHASSGNGQVLSSGLTPIINTSLQQVVDDVLPDYIPENSELQFQLQLTEYTVTPDYERLYTALQHAIQTQVGVVANTIAEKCRDTLCSLEKSIADLQCFVEDRDDALKRIKASLRAPLA
ncbi:MAG: hypothetical protein GX086_10370 [Alcaligenaceae bacterium]|nr:hypothetical protein [Alcaligenaceae bacterium]